MVNYVQVIGNWFRSIKSQRSNLFSQLAPFAAILASFLFLVLTGWGSIDFGYHWDEVHHLGVAKHYILSEQLLAEWYIYPSMSSYLALFATLPYLIPFLFKSGVTWPAIKGFLFNSVFNNNPTYPLNVRKLFLLISVFAIIWIFLYKIKRKRHWVEALLAVGILGLSWEVAYHIRFIAVDGIVMQFGALITLMTMLALHQPKHARRWLVLATIAAGLATSTKYPAGALLIPVLVAAYMVWDKKAFVREFVPRVFGLLFIFGMTYLVITPGTVLDPFAFYKDVSQGLRIYGTGHGMQTVQAGFDHFWRMLIYLSQVSFSHYRAIAFVFFLGAVYGTYRMYRESRRDTILFLSFPIFYVVFFSFQSVMFIRNMLVLIPFLAILSARGIVSIFHLLKSKPLQIAWVSLISGLLLINAGWLLYSAGTIQDRGTDRFITEFQTYVISNSDITFLVSDQVWDDLTAVSSANPTNLRRQLSADVDMVVVYYYESTAQPGLWPVNSPGLAPNWFGPYEVNLDYYASWQGDDRILVMPLEKAEELNILLLQGN